MPGRDGLSDNPGDGPTILPQPWQSGWREQLGCAAGTRAPSGPACSRSRSHERAVIGPDGGVATPRGNARCSLHVARARRVGAGSRGRGHPDGGAASRRRAAGQGSGRLQGPGRRGTRGVGSEDLRRDSHLEPSTRIDAVVAHGASTPRRGLDRGARAPRIRARPGLRLAFAARGLSGWASPAGHADKSMTSISRVAMLER